MSYHPSHYKIVFMSSAPIGVPFLQAFVQDNRFQVTGVVTMPDAPVGRGMQMQENIIKKEAKKITWLNHKQDIVTPSKINPEKSQEAKDFAQRLFSKQADFLVVIAYGKILPQSILDIPRIAPINVHGSILPAYRGATPIQSVLLDGQDQTGITIIKMDAGCDTGDIIKIHRFPIQRERTSWDIISKMQEVWPNTLCDALWSYGAGDLVAKPQDFAWVTYCGKISKQDWFIDPWSDSLAYIYAHYRAYYLRPKIFFVYQGRQHIITRLQVDPVLYHQYHHMPLVWVNDTLHPAVVQLQIHPANKKPINYRDRLRWYKSDTAK